MQNHFYSRETKQNQNQNQFYTSKINFGYSKNEMKHTHCTKS
ncbi:hypothetical protein MtrunA17_Chr2g0312341 [Medicago truncatula]|uniref:Uncharacterized protein n=1 Tax=Medicago truncatula TaxID=3880 RepID=A0A396J8P4_MEDTR|nr:hypothetical protein MtrunA17_Chr2g0312341 [Medicago truncatula]